MDCNEKKEVKKESPIDTALDRLLKEIANLQETTVRFETILASVLGHQEKTNDCDAPNSKGQTSLETRLMEMTEQIMDVNANLRSIQNRVQL